LTSDDFFQGLFDAVDPTKGISDAQLAEKFPLEQLASRLRTDIVVKRFCRFYRRPWRRATLFILSITVLVAGTATAFTLLRSPIRVATTLSCYQFDSLSSNVDVVGFSGNPLAACASVAHWSESKMTSTPRGFLCVLSNGSLAGFPLSSKRRNCEFLGLPSFDGRFQKGAEAKFQQSLQRYFSVHTCVTSRIARAEVQDAIGKFGLSEWRVRVSGSLDARACSTLNIQAGRRTVNIVEIGK
jgi:hypothetical protein